MQARSLKRATWFVNKSPQDLVDLMRSSTINENTTPEDIMIEKLQEEDRIKSAQIQWFSMKQLDLHFSELTPEKDDHKIIYDDGTVYIGEIQNGIKHGRGKLLDPKGDVFEGEFVNDIIKGMGVFTGSNGTVYKGQWRAGRQEGYGQESWADGSSYEGNYLKGIKHGKGEYRWADGSNYNGDWKNGNTEGTV